MALKHFQEIPEAFPDSKQVFPQARHGFGQCLHDVVFILGVDANTAFLPDGFQQAHCDFFTRIFLFGTQIVGMPQRPVFRLRMIRPLNRYGLIGMGMCIQGNGGHHRLEIQMMDRVPDRLKPLRQLWRNPFHVLPHTLLQVGQRNLRRNLVDGFNPLLTQTPHDVFPTG